jgi:hypothetical protein
VTLIDYAKKAFVGRAPKHCFAVKKFAPDPTLKPVPNQGFGDRCRQILRKVDDLEGFRWAGEARYPVAGTERGGRVRHRRHAHIGSGRDRDGETRHDIGIKDHA